MTKFSKPQHIANLKEAKLWSTDWAQQTFPDAEWWFYICQKQEDGTYMLYGMEYDADAAFTLRRELVEELGTSKLFIRAKRRPPVEARFDADSDAAYEACKDFYNEGRGIQDVPMSLRPAFKEFCQSKGRSAR